MSSIELQHHILKLSRHFFFIYSPKCPSFSTTHSCGPNIALSSLNLSPICWCKVFSIVECCFCHDNPAFNFRSTSYIICHHATQTVELFHILHFFFIIICTGDGCVESLFILVFSTFISIPKHFLTSASFFFSLISVHWDHYFKQKSFYMLTPLYPHCYTPICFSPQGGHPQGVWYTYFVDLSQEKYRYSLRVAHLGAETYSSVTVLVKRY